MRIKDETKEFKPVGALDTAYPFAYYGPGPDGEPGSVIYGMVTADIANGDMITAVDMRGGKKFRLRRSTLVEPLPKAVFRPYGEEGRKTGKEDGAE